MTIIVRINTVLIPQMNACLKGIAHLIHLIQYICKQIFDMIRSGNLRPKLVPRNPKIRSIWFR